MRKFIFFFIFTENSDKPLFQPAALQFLAGKISANSGDVRKALDVCREALKQQRLKIGNQTLLSPLKPGQTPEVQPIGIPQILKIVNGIYTSNVTSASVELPLQQKMLLATMLLMSNHRNNKEITVGNKKCFLGFDWNIAFKFVLGRIIQREERVC